MELKGPGHSSGRSIKQLNEVYAAKTIDRVAAELGETVHRLHDLVIGVEPEYCVIWIHGTAKVAALAFTSFGVENLLDNRLGKRPSDLT